MARYLIDANLPRYLAVWGSGCEFVADLDPSMADRDIWSYAAAHGLTIVSKDADFANLVLLSSAGPSVIHLKIGNMKFNELNAFLTRFWADICDLSGRHRLIQVFTGRIEAVS